MDDRLLFPLCRSCAQENKIGRYDPDYFCKHHDGNDRNFVSTAAILELKLALDHGYVVRRLYRAYLFEKYGLFNN